MTTKRVPTRTTDEYGRAIVKVPLAKDRGEAIVYAEDFDRLIDWGLSSSWFINGRGPGYVRAALKDTPGSIVGVGRLIMVVGDGKRVHYRDHNPLNLRRSNLRVARGYAVRCDANELVRTRLERQAREAALNAHV